MNSAARRMAAGEAEAQIKGERGYGEETCASVDARPSVRMRKWGRRLKAWRATYGVVDLTKTSGRHWPGQGQEAKGRGRSEDRDAGQGDLVKRRRSMGTSEPGRGSAGTGRQADGKVRTRNWKNGKWRYVAASGYAVRQLPQPNSRCAIHARHGQLSEG